MQFETLCDYRVTFQLLNVFNPRDGFACFFSDFAFLFLQVSLFIYEYSSQISVFTIIMSFFFIVLLCGLEVLRS